MAETLKPGAGDDDSGRVTEQHNVAAREALIQTTYQKFVKFNEEERDAIDEYVRPIREERTKLMRTAKADTGIPIGVLKAQFKIAEMAKFAATNEEENSNAATIDDMREVFAALKKGGQLDFTTVVDGSDNRGADNVTSINAGA